MFVAFRAQARAGLLSSAATPAGSAGRGGHRRAERMFVAFRAQARAGLLSSAATQGCSQVIAA